MVEFLRFKDVSKATTLPRGSIYQLIKDGLFPRPCRLGKRIAAFPKDEIGKFLAARLRGASDSEIKALIIKIHAERKQVAL